MCIRDSGKDEALLMNFIRQRDADSDEILAYDIQAALCLLDANNLPIRGKRLSYSTLIWNEAGRSMQDTHPSLDKTTFEKLRAGARAGQLTPIMPELPELQVGGQRLREQ